MGKDDEITTKDMAHIWNKEKPPDGERELFSCRIQLASIPGLEERLRCIFIRNELEGDFHIVEYEPTTSGHLDVTISVNRQAAEAIRAKGYRVQDAINKIKMTSVKAPVQPHAKM